VQYINLVNEALRRINEVTLNSSNFTNNLTGPQAFIKDAVNDALRDIYIDEMQWPFNYAQGTQVLTVGTQFYNLPADYAHVDYKSFYITKNIPDTSVQGKQLFYIDYQFWRDQIKERDDSLVSTGYGIPDNVFRLANDKFGVTTVPDKAYSITFDYWKRFTPLVNFDDTSLVPDRYSGVIKDGVLKYAYLFREDIQQSAVQDERFKKGVSRMRMELIGQELSARPR